MPITESMSITSYVNDDSSESVPTPSHNKPYKVRKLLINASPVRARRNIGSNTESQEDLLEDTRNKRNSDNIEQKHNSISTQLIGNYGTNSSKRYSRKSGGEKIVDRVHSIVAPRSFKTPERFLLEPDGELNSSSWLKANFPLNAETVTIPRGERGFGFIMVEEKVSIEKYDYWHRHSSNLFGRKKTLETLKTQQTQLFLFKRCYQEA